MASWHRFQEVVINFSIDGIGSRFEYLRYPLQWSKVEANIGRLVNETGLNLKFHINHTVTPLNIWYYDEFVEWTKRTFPSHRLSGIHTHTAYGVMNVAATTLKVRKMIQHKYGSNHVLYKMLQSNPESTNNFWQWIDLWDQRRNTDWQQVFPDIV
jgi:sulfatase maturation enzyme AslB (radical SAM superfamily)